MTTAHRLASLLGFIAALALSACTALNPTSDEPYQGGTQSRSNYSGYGVVTSIEGTQEGYQGIAGTGYGLGTVAGAVIGGVAGNQVGSGNGKTAATVVGSAGGAYIGHQLEKRNQPAPGYAITVRMSNGEYQTLTQATTGDLRVGDRVHIENGSMQRY